MLTWGSCFWHGSLLHTPAFRSESGRLAPFALLFPTLISEFVAIPFSLTGSSFSFMFCGVYLNLIVQFPRNMSILS